MEEIREAVQLPPIEGVDELYAAYADMVYRLARVRTRSSADAEDVTSEVFLRYLKSKPQLADREHQKAWFLRVTINCSSSLLTSAWRRHLAPEPPDDSRTPAVEQEDHSDVYEAVLALPGDLRTAIHLFYYEGYSVEEICAITGAGVSAVKSRLFRAREQLRRKLRGEYFHV